MLPGAGGLELRSAARDLWSGPDGATAVLGAASAHARLGGGRRLASLETDPPVAATADLVGRPVATGFRAAVDAALPDERAGRTLLYRLLEELPVAALISGYAALYRHQPLTRAGGAGGSAPGLPADVCAGWRADGVMMQAIARDGAIPIPLGPVAPALDAGDPLAWHAMAPLAPDGMRRRRLLDLAAPDGPEAPLVVTAMFRDSHVEPGGTETVLHHYDVDVLVDPVGRRVLACRATPRVLPWPECPAAAASAGRLVGRRVDEVPALVRTDLRGTSTCTHLNDLLRTLGDVGALADQLLARTAAG